MPPYIIISIFAYVRRQLRIVCLYAKVFVCLYAHVVVCLYALKFLESVKSVTTSEGKNKVPVCAEIREIGEILKSWTLSARENREISKTLKFCGYAFMR